MAANTEAKEAAEAMLGFDGAPDEGEESAEAALVSMSGNENGNAAVVRCPILTWSAIFSALDTYLASMCFAGMGPQPLLW